MLRKTKLQCGHVIDVRDTATATWCPYCGDVVDVGAPVPGQPVVADPGRFR
jgi:acetone carboxylase gamma subunit